VIFAGTNDIFLYSQTGAQTAALLQTYVDARNAAGWAYSDICVCTMLPRQSANESARTAYNSDIRTNAIKGYVVADVGADATIGVFSAPTNTTYYSDTIHPTDAGHAIVASIIKTAFFP